MKKNDGRVFNHVIISDINEQFKTIKYNLLSKSVMVRKHAEGNTRGKKFHRGRFFVRFRVLFTTLVYISDLKLI